MTGNTTQHDDEPGVLTLLGMHEPGLVRDARVRARCHHALEKRRRRALRPVRPAWRRELEPALVGTLCAVYLFEVLSRAIQLYRF
jgi:hypothetical protein